ncbi:MAG TPA: hypothetical protein VGQ42_15130 [Candidatus Dormibacteraeota bacterium]|jgi:hypothetical protein|nr:hypothetical protein [Candidatus Dormibacteraeota bacterium]
MTMETAHWHWCPLCKLAASKPGNCPGCGRPYVLAPEVGIPDTAYSPEIRPERSVRAVVASSVVVALIVAAAIGAVILLAAHGSTTDSTSGALAGSATTASHVDGLSTYGVAPLHGTLRLQGTWENSTQQVSLPNAVTAGAKVKSELSAGKGADTVVVVSFPSPDPSGALNQMVATAPQTNTDSVGQKVTTQPTRELTIAGYTAIAQDFETRNAKGGLLNRGTFYLVNAGDQVVVIRTSAVPAQAADLPGIEQALVAIG